MRIPKQTDPMTKFIRTGEGVLVFAFNLALLIVPIVSNSLSAAESAKWLAILDGVVVVSRTGLKIVAAANSAPGATAEELVASSAATVIRSGRVEATRTSAREPAGHTDLSDLEHVVTDVVEFASRPPQDAQHLGPGVTAAPADFATHGLAVGNGQPNGSSAFVVRLGE